MPELPEMQALAERLDAALSGHALAAATPIGFSGLKTPVDPATIEGRVLERAGRRGKYLVLELGGPRVLVHLSQGGRVDVERPPKSSRPKGGVVRFRFEGAPSVLVKEYGSQRKAGWWILEPGDDGPLARLGPEPFSDEFAALVATSDDRRRIHTVLRDQRTVAGVGRGYADDALHRARLSPYASLATLGTGERARLVDAVRAVLSEGLDVERTRTGGLPAKLGDHWIVHGRWGAPCPACGAELKRVSYEDYDVTYCPSCQTGGKVLADRRLSRLVR
ncbi:MAG TPA: DNA-formamidopyrimidine glycosylase family protein [Actinomycetota bacterium]|nr:DNA-formamidopyrimidine glycosylase family protein [Actinomycetota bacterium]